jgi:hypothetical protein
MLRNRKADNKVLITSYGLEDLGYGRSHRHKLQGMVKALARSKGEISAAVMAIPPHPSDRARDQDVKAANCYLQDLCKELDVPFIDSNLDHRDTGRNDQVNAMGRIKMATAIKGFVKDI